ncbi:MAG: DUF1906 domain-containing protein [Acidobacteria bacterium]|nr:DUF1906 domain-containing protein [Acidobacteriota bacterium]
MSAAGPPYWGVDSVENADHNIRTQQEFIRAGDPPRQTFFEFVTRRVGRQPAFWGRYLNRHPSCLTKTEADYLHRHNCRVLLVYNGVHRHAADLVGQAAYRNGARAAEAAADIAATLGVPSSVQIYADIERWRADAAWFRGWFETMHALRRAGLGGIYGNVGLRQSRAEGFRDSLGQGSEQVAHDYGAPGHPTPTRAAPPDAIVQVWSNRPYLNNVGHDFSTLNYTPPSFQPEVAPPDVHCETVVWQYGANVPLHTEGRHYVDFDLCTERGRQSMWG